MFLGCHRWRREVRRFAQQDWLAPTSDSSLFLNSVHLVNAERTGECIVRSCGASCR
jgi:hypothetical protein